MSKLSRLVDMASKALGNTSAPSSARGSDDWTGRVRSVVGALGGEPRGAASSRPSTTPPSATDAQGTAADRAAIARYDYLMRTADPQSIEQIHREAFERLTPQQRAQIEARMNAELPSYERPASSSAPDLARAAGRTEAARPGRMRSLLAGAGAGALGGGIGVLGAVAGGAVLSAVAVPMLAQAADLGVDFGALADGVNLGELTGGAEGLLTEAGEQVTGLGEQIGGVTDQLGGFELPNIRDLFG